MEFLIWIGIIICISQSAMFSGLNLAFFNISKLRLEVTLPLELEMSKNNQQAFPIAKLREDSNFLLSTILWGNVSVNVLLTLLSGSVLAGAAAFLFSTFVITIVGEIIPQSYLSRNSMKAASFLAPAIKFYQVLLYPLAKPTAILLNKWLGKEAIQYIQEEDLMALMKLQLEKQSETRVTQIEGRGMISVMNFDKVLISQIGSVVDTNHIIQISHLNDDILTEIPPDTMEQLVTKVKYATSQWIILTNEHDIPCYMLDAYALMLDLYKMKPVRPADHFRKPLIFYSGKNTFLDVLEAINEIKSDLRDQPSLVLLWTPDERRIITNQDALLLITRDIFAMS